jgi:hypothetical protein
VDYRWKKASVFEFSPWIFVSLPIPQYILSVYGKPVIQKNVVWSFVLEENARELKIKASNLALVGES